ncbi:MAG TPA: hypothetical protein VD906_09645 [Caulobacteraceae bacterium]|nr:hypothetical protein [Caulobacteraceae bacterium]
MRFGFVRSDPALPAVDTQVRLLSAAGCGGQVIDVEAGHAGAERLDKFVQNLTADDVVCVVSLKVFGRAGRGLAQLLLSLAEASVGLSFISLNGEETLVPTTAECAALLAQLFEALPPDADQSAPPTWYGRAFTPAADFTEHQRDHVLKLYEDGASLRVIGLIFKTSPNEVMKVVTEARRMARLRRPARWS